MEIRKQSMTAVVASLKAAGSHFFDRDTLRFFNDVPGNWDAFMIGPRMFIRNVRHRHGPGMLSGCTLRGQVREVFGGGESVGMPIKELHGLKPRAIVRLVESGAV